MLPSGQVAPLEAPDLTALLVGGGASFALCAAAWAHPGVDPEQLGRDDIAFVADWTLARFIEGDEAAEFAATCVAVGTAPSARLGIEDRRLAYAFDRGCLLAAQRAASEAKPSVGFNAEDVLND